MSIANKAFIHRWFEEVWNRKRKGAIEEMLHQDALLHGLSEPPIRGPQGFVPFWQKFVSAFPNMTIAVESVVAEDDLIVARCHVRGKHTGSELGIAPTNREVAFGGMGMARIRDGKIVEAWNNFDFLTLYQQIGIVAV